MISLKLFFVLALAHYVVSDSNLPSVDPLFIKAVEVNIPNEAGLVIRYHNLNITGLDNRDVLDYKIDTDARSVWLRVKAKLHVVGHIEFEFTKESKTFGGLYTLDADVIEKIEYDYELVDNGKEILELKTKNEKLTCESYGEPKIEVSSELENAFKSVPKETSADPNIEELKTIRQEMLWKLTDAAFGRLFEIFKSIPKSVPAEVFFNDLKNHKIQ